MKRYVATLTQAGANAPQCFTTHHNTLGGDPVFTFFADGQFQVNLAGLVSPGRFIAYLTVPFDANEGWSNQVHPSGDLLNILTYINGTLSNDCMSSGQCLVIEAY